MVYRFNSVFNLHNDVSYTSDNEGQLLDKALKNSFTFSGLLQSTFKIGNTISNQQYNGVEFNLLNYSISARLNPTGNSLFNISSSFGDSIDFVKLHPTCTGQARTIFHTASFFLQD
jgi:hypothetical protein